MSGGWVFPGRSGEHFPHHPAVDIGQAEIAAGMAEGEPLVVDAQLVQQGGVQVMHVHLVLHGLRAELVGGTKAEPGPEAAAGQENGEAAGVVVAAGAVLLGVGRAAELAAKPDDCVVEQAAALQVDQQARHWLIHRAGVLGVLGHVAVLVPGWIGAAVAVGHLHEAHTRLHQPAGQQALAPEGLGGFLVDAVQAFGLGRFAIEVEEAGGRELHARRQLIRFAHRVDDQVGGVQFPLPGEQALQQVQRLGGGGAGFQVANRLPRERCAGPAQGGSLHGGRQEAAAIVAGPAVAGRGGDGHKAGQVVALAAQAILHPGTHAGSYLRGGAGVQKQGCGTVRHPLGVHGMDEAQVIHAPVEVGEQFRAPVAALAVAVELPQRLHHAVVTAAGPGVGQHPGIVERKHLAVIGGEAGLVVEAVHLADAALHEDKDDPLGPGGMVRSERAGSGPASQTREGQGTEAAACRAQGRPPGKTGRLCWLVWHGSQSRVRKSGEANSAWASADHAASGSLPEGQRSRV